MIHLFLRYWFVCRKQGHQPAQTIYGLQCARCGRPLDDDDRAVSGFAS